MRFLEEALLLPQHDDAIPPRETLRDLLEGRGLSVGEFARRMGWTPQEVALLLDDQADMPITPATAEGLARAFGLPADFWLSCERLYRDGRVPQNKRLANPPSGSAA
jgi:plasmid maintenance system antidote protein VapI